MIRLVLVRLLVVVVSAAVVVSMQLRADPEHARPPHVLPPVSAGLPGPPAEVNAAEVAAWIEGQQREQWIGGELARLAQEAEEKARAVAVRPSVPRPATTANRSAHSDAWWRAISVCEQGGRNDPRFGYFSIMDGSAGGLDWDTQVHMANGIIARAGDGAWAAVCVQQAYAAAPGG